MNKKATMTLDELASMMGMGGKAKPYAKYRNVRTEYAGERYDSKAEAAYAERLDADVKSGRVLWYVRQVAFRLGCPENIYRCDFLVVSPKNTFVVDVKGVETPKFRRDKNLWRSYGPCELVVVKDGETETIPGRRAERIETRR